jgi:four helix bundle protein
MAYSSLLEVLSQIILCNDLDYISMEQLSSTRSQIDQTSKFLLGLIKAKGNTI